MHQVRKRQNIFINLEKEGRLVFLYQFAYIYMININIQVK